MSHAVFQPAVGLLARGDRASGRESERARTRLAPLVDAFADLDVRTEAVVYDDEHVAEVRHQLLGLDGVLVWVNPVQDGADRGRLDALLREVSERGVWVSAHPDVVLRMGTKEVLHSTRTLGWGTDTAIYRTPAELSTRFPDRLRDHGVLVLKQGRGMGGIGVWKVELDRSQVGTLMRDPAVRVQHAQSRDGASERLGLGAFMERCYEYFRWSGFLVDQPFQIRLADGLIRAYFTHDRLVGFQHQWPAGLLDTEQLVQHNPRGMEDPDAPAYEGLRASLAGEWIPQLTVMLGLDVAALPVIWDADFLYGPRTAAGADSHVLCEINVSCVWPYPPQASATIAAAALDRVRRAIASRESPGTRPS